MYIREAHPDSVLYTLKEGKETLATVGQTETVTAREENAQICLDALKLTCPTVIDFQDNRVNHAYAGWPDRFIVVDVDGRVAYYGEPGPAGFIPGEVESWLKTHTPERKE